MKTLYTCLLILISSIVVAFFSSCNRKECPDSTTTTRQLDSSTISKVPYNGFDTLYFINGQGDTCIVRGNGKQYYYSKEAEQGNIPVCEPDYITYQGYRIAFSPIKGDLSFFLTLESSQNITIVANNYDYSFVLWTNSIGIKGYPDNPLYIDTMTILEKSYTTIRKAFTSEIVHPWITNDSYKLYYNKEFGILKIQNEESNEEYSFLPN